MKDIFLSWTNEIVLYRMYNKLLKYYIPLFYKYSFWLLRLIKIKTSLFFSRKFVYVFPKWYIFFPFHKLIQQSHLKDVEFYDFFLKNTNYQGFFLSKALIFNNISLLLKKKHLLYFNELFGGLNYLVINKSWNFLDSLQASNKKFETKLNWNKTNLSFKNSIISKPNLHFLQIYNFYILNDVFFLVLSLLKDFYNFFILLLILKN